MKKIPLKYSKILSHNPIIGTLNLEAGPHEALANVIVEARGLLRNKALDLSAVHVAYDEIWITLQKK